MAESAMTTCLLTLRRVALRLSCFQRKCPGTRRWPFQGSTFCSPDPCPGALLYLTAVPAQAQVLRAQAQQVQAPTGVALLAAAVLLGALKQLAVKSRRYHLTKYVIRVTLNTEIDTA